MLQQDLDPEFLREVSDTLELISTYHGDSLDLCLPEIIGLVLFWEDRSATYGSKPISQSAISFAQEMLTSIYFSSTLRNAKALLKVCASRQPSTYVDLLLKARSSSTSSRIGDASLLDALGSVVQEQALFDRATPLLFAALESERPQERVAALRALAEMGRREGISLSGFEDCVLAALMSDDILGVVLAAIHAVGRIEVSAEGKCGVINRLLQLSQMYGPERRYSDDIRIALRQVLRLSQGEPYEEPVGDLVLDIIRTFPPAESGRLLDRLPLEKYPGWPAAVVHALHIDSDPNWSGIGDDTRRRLLRHLAEIPTEQFTSLSEELETVGLERLPHDPAWAWAIADVFAYHGQHEQAATVCDAVMAGLPNTREKRPARRFARQIALGHHLNVAAAKEDVENFERLLEEWEQLSEEAELHFTLDGSPVSWPMALNPGRGYQLGALTTVEKWPADAERLIIDLESDVPPSILERTSISVPRGEQMGTAYLVPKVEIDPSCSVELTPTVFFQTSTRECRPASIVGQRSLRVTTFDPNTLGSGQPMVAQRIIELLGELDARLPSLPTQDRRNLIHLLGATARFAALANERDDLRGLDERGFQTKLKQAFAQDRFIGRRIQEAPKLGGGVTDLVLERIVVELKIDHEGLGIDSACRYVRQPTQYASANDCPISMLITLDDSPKSEPPGVQSNYMCWDSPKLHGVSLPAVPSMVAVVLIPIGFPVPSGWSRKKRDVGHSK